MESLWQIRSLFLQRLRRAGRDSWQLRQSHRAGEDSRQFRQSRRAGGDSWQLRQSHRAGGDSRQFRQSRRAGEDGRQSAHPLARAMVEILFWSVTTLIISMFLYYCAWGKLSVHAGLGFFTGLLLWKKMCCAIIKTWEKTDEAKNLKITARSSRWRKPAPGGSKKDVQRKKKRKKRSCAPNSRTPEASEPSAEAGPGEK